MIKLFQQRFIFLVCILLFIPVSVYATETDYVSVNVYNQIYYGTLTKDLSSDEDLTIFTTLPDSDLQFTISGKYKNNTFTKDCTITYDDGTIQNVTYKKGLISGEVTSFNPDGTQQKFSCTSGNPYGTLTTYSKDGELIDLDWFYQCTPIQDLISLSIPAEYEMLSSNLYYYIGFPLKIQGTVDAVYEDATQSYLKIRDNNNNIYLFGYPNPNTYKYSKSQIELPSVGDTVTVIGTLTELHEGDSDSFTFYDHALGYTINYSNIQSSIADNEFIQAVKDISCITDSDLAQNFLEFETIYCQVDNRSVDPLSLQYTYEEICRCPLYYKNIDISLSGTVLYQNIDLEEQQIDLLVQKDNSQEIYNITYEIDNDTPIDSIESLLNQKIYCTGTFNDNAKYMYYSFDTKTCGYVLYPSISTSDVILQ